MKWNLPEPAAVFAGFTFPKWCWTLPRGADVNCAFRTPQHQLDLLQQRARDRRHQMCGPEYQCLRPNAGEQWVPEAPGRKEFCDDVCPHINHTGWFVDDDCGSKMRGIVVRLSKQRGFLAGWQFSESGGCVVSTVGIYDDHQEAAQAADRRAREAAESEKEYQEKAAAAGSAEALDIRTEFDEDFGVPGAYRISERLEELLMDARALGLVITIDTKPIGHAMGSYSLSATVRPSIDIIRSWGEEE